MSSYASSLLMLSSLTCDIGKYGSSGTLRLRWFTFFFHATRVFRRPPVTLARPGVAKCGGRTVLLFFLSGVSYASSSSRFPSSSSSSSFRGRERVNFFHPPPPPSRFGFLFFFFFFFSRKTQQTVSLILIMRTSSSSSSKTDKRKEGGGKRDQAKQKKNPLYVYGPKAKAETDVNKKRQKKGKREEFLYILS